MKTKQLLIFPIIFSILSSIVFAAQQNWLRVLLEPFFGWDIAGTYKEAAPFIDFVLYIFIFLYVTRIAIAQRFEGATAKSLSIILAIMLAIGMAVFESMFHFNLGMLAPLSGLILFAVIAIIAFNVLKGFGAGGTSAGAWAFLLIYGILSATASEYLKWLYDKVPMLEGLLYIGMIFAIFGAIKSFGDIWKSTTQWGPTVGETGGALNKGGKWLTGLFKKTDEEIAAGNEKIAAEEEDIKKIEGQIDEIQKQLGRTYPASEKYFEELDALEVSKDQKVRMIKAEISQINQELDKIKILNEELDKIKETGFGTDPRIGPIEEKLNEEQAKFEDYRNKLYDTIRSLAFEDQTEIKEIETLIGAAEQTITLLEKDIELLNKKEKKLVEEYKDTRELLKKTTDRDELHKLASKMAILSAKIQTAVDNIKKTKKEEKVEEKTLEDLKKAKELEKKEMSYINQIRIGLEAINQKTTEIKDYNAQSKDKTLKVDLKTIMRRKRNRTQEEVVKDVNKIEKLINKLIKDEKDITLTMKKIKELRTTFKDLEKRKAENETYKQTIKRDLFK